MLALSGGLVLAQYFKSRDDRPRERFDNAPWATIKSLLGAISLSSQEKKRPSLGRGVCGFTVDRVRWGGRCHRPRS
jgi:hypothetical protein